MVLMVLGVSMAQAPAARDGVITGQVVDAVTGKPVSAVIVSIGGLTIPVHLGPSPPPGQPRILTGADGRFVFRGLSPGSFTITATKSGYVDGSYGKRRPNGTSESVVLTEAVRSADAPVRMWKNGAITGTVADEAGEPVVGVQVRALGRTLVAGRPRFGGSGPLLTAVTDDRGVYRFSNLPVGDYIIVASSRLVAAPASMLPRPGTRAQMPPELQGATGMPGSASAMQVGDAVFALGRGSVIPPPPEGGRMFAYPPVFHPSAPMPAQAAAITIASGEERAGVDLQLQPVTTARVSGVLMSPAGPAPGVILRLLAAGFEDVTLEQDAPATASDAAGNFVFPAVPSGQYLLHSSSAGGPPGSNFVNNWLSMPLAVGGTDVDGVVAQMRPGLRISGRVQFEGATPPPAGNAARPAIMIESADGRSFAFPGQFNTVAGLALDLDEARTFAAGAFAAGKYFVRVQNSPAGWMFKGATIDGRDVSDTPFDLDRDATSVVITFTDRWSGMGGDVQGAGADGALVVIFPTGAESWTNYGLLPRRVRSARANAKGEFSMSSLPAGDYYVAAIADEQSAEWRDPKTLEALARVATRVTILEGEHKTVTLRMQEVR
jgi:hypothetical protein